MSGEPMYRLWLTVSRNCYGKHFVELSEEQNKMMPDLVALFLMEAKEKADSYRH